MKKLALFAIFVFAWSFGATPASVSAQNWQEIEPLRSKCVDIKRIFKVEDCSLPTTRLEFPTYNIKINFKRPSDYWNVSNDTVVGVTIIFKDLMKLRDYENDFSDYVIKPESDAPEITIYKNSKKGIELSVQTPPIVTEPYIYDIVLTPSEKNARKYKCTPRPKCK